MIKTKGYVDYQGKQIEKMWVEGNIIKGEMKNNTFFFTLASYKGKDVQSEYTNNIAVTDEKKAAIIKGLKKGTQLFCELNVTHKTVNEKSYENLYLFGFAIGKEGKGEQVLASTPSNNNDQIDEQEYC